MPAALASMHGAVANDSAEIQREWAKYMQKVQRGGCEHDSNQEPQMSRTLHCSANDLFSFLPQRRSPLRSQQLRLPVDAPDPEASTPTHSMTGASSACLDAGDSEKRLVSSQAPSSGVRDMQ